MPAIASAEKSFDRAWPALKAPLAARGAAAILAASLALAAMFVAERRIAEALVVPLDALALSFTAAVAALCAAGARFAWRISETPLDYGKNIAHGRLSLRERACFRGAKADHAPAAGPSWLSPPNAMNALVRWLPLAALVVLGVSLWLPGTSLAAIACFWGIAILEEAWSLLPRRPNLAESSDSADSRPAEKIELHLQPATPLEFSAIAKETDLEDSEEIDHEALEAEHDLREEQESPTSGHGKLAGPHYAPPRPASAANLCDPPHPEPAAPHFGLTNKAGDAGASADERVVQQLTRSTTREGVDVLRGSLHATFPPGLRTLSIHVAFCPAFAERPRVDFRQTSGPAARIKLAQLLAFGARFDLKLAAPAEVDETVVLEISAAHP